MSRIMKKPLSEAQLERQRQAGKARAAGCDMVALGKLGGRPTWQEALEKARSREAERAEASKLASRPGRKPAGWVYEEV